MTLRVWSEFLPFERLTDPALLKLLAHFRLSLCLAIPPSSEEGPPLLARALGACAEHGVPVSWWVLLEESAGYWPCETNLLAYEQRVSTLRSWALQQRLPFESLAVDLELPLPQVQAFRAAQGWAKAGVARRIVRENLQSQRFEQSVRDWSSFAQRLHHEGVSTLCAALDVVVDDLFLPQPVFQDVLETPIWAVGWQTVSVMHYNSLLAQLFGCSEADARWQQYVLGLKLVERLGPSRVGFSLGLTGVGVLGDEAFYTSPESLRLDVAAARAAGVQELALYDLRGLLNQAQPEKWLEILCHTEGFAPVETPWARKSAWVRRGLGGLLRLLRH